MTMAEGMRRYGKLFAMAALITVAATSVAMAAEKPEEPKAQNGEKPAAVKPINDEKKDEKKDEQKQEQKQDQKQPQKPEDQQKPAPEKPEQKN